MLMWSKSVLLVIASSSSIAFSAPNVYVTSGDYQNPMLREYTYGGSLVRSWNVPYPASATDTGGVAARGVCVTDNGRVHVMVGTFEPYIATLNVAAGTWTHKTFEGLSVPLSGFNGRIAAFGQYVYAADRSTGSGADMNGGIVRFDMENGTAERFYGTGADKIDFTTVTIGNDRMLYALATGANANFYKFNPISMSLAYSVSGRSFNDIDVDSSGHVYGIDDSTVYKMLPQTNLAPLASLTLPQRTLWNCDLSLDNELVIGRYGTDSGFYTLDTSLQSALFRNTAGFQAVHVGFAQAVPEPGIAASAAATSLVILARRRQGQR